MLTVIKPEGVNIIDKNTLVMRSAEEVRWGYYSYGEKIKSENWREQIYHVKEKHVLYREIPSLTISEDKIEFDEEYLVYISFPSN